MVRSARDFDRDQLADMRALLWPDSSFEEHNMGGLPEVNLIAEDDDGTVADFVEVGRRSRADGCDTSRAVGFIEGWFVYEAFRCRGFGRYLMRAAEEWRGHKDERRWRPTPGSITRDRGARMTRSGSRSSTDACIIARAFASDVCPHADAWRFGILAG